MRSDDFEVWLSQEIEDPFHTLLPSLTSGEQPPAGSAQVIAPYVAALAVRSAEAEAMQRDVTLLWAAPASWRDGPLCTTSKWPTCPRGAVSTYGIRSSVSSMSTSGSHPKPACSALRSGSTTRPHVG